MATINYQFSDGHFEEIEVTEEFKQEYELLERQDLRRYWKIKQQKYRAGIGCKYDLSLDWMNEYGQEPHSVFPDPLETLIKKDERERYRNSLKKKLTARQWQVYELYHFKHYKKVEIAKILHISEKAVRERLLNAEKRI